MNRGAIGAFLALCLCCPALKAQNRAVPAVATVLITADLKFSPASVTVHAGDIVRWLNASRNGYTLTTDYRKAKKPGDVALPINADPFDSGEIPSGGSWMHQFTLPGTYRYFCVQHEKEGMVGEVVVEPGGKPVP